MSAQPRTAPGRTIAHVALLVRNYDEAIAFFTTRLRFDLIEDSPLGDGKRWVLVAPEQLDALHLQEELDESH